ncbi:hypothetical protein EGR95_02170 [bacterium]|nr:hypothetical protein [bacterium]
MFTNKMIWQIDEYMLYCQSKQLSEKTMESYEQTLHLFERWCGEKMLIEKCDEQNRRKALPANRQMGIEKA